MSQAAADELQHRLVSFAVKIIELVVHLPKTAAGRHVSSLRLRFASADKPALKIRLAGRSLGKGWKLGWCQPS